MCQVFLLFEKRPSLFQCTIPQSINTFVPRIWRIGKPWPGAQCKVAEVTMGPLIGVVPGSDSAVADFCLDKYKLKYFNLFYEDCQQFKWNVNSALYFSTELNNSISFSLLRLI
jgi:hypothetical protein